MPSPEFPDVVVDLSGMEDRPVASLALVRRSLQKAGHRDAATRFTDESLGEPAERLVAIASRYVTIVV